MNTVIDLSVVAVNLCRERGYTYVRELGKGSFKSAYLVESPNGLVALKLAIVEGLTDRLAREISALQTCTHPSIAKLLETFSYQSDQTSIWVVIEECLAAGTLEQRLKVAKMTCEEVRHIGICLAEVLGHLHERRLVHRDIKPANILFREGSDIPVLTDFGVVRMLDQPTLTRAFMGMGPGTPAYAAPEQLNNEKVQIDWRTDQFGLAVVLSECLIGRHPFLSDGESLYDAIIAVASRKVLPASTNNELLRLGFGCLIPALQSWPVSRYRKPNEFIEALKKPGGV